MSLIATWRVRTLVPVALIATLAVGALATLRLPAQPRALAEGEPAAASQDKASGEDDRPADRAAVRAALDAFLKAFRAGDAKALAATWTAECEYRTDDGTVIRGRAAIEKDYAQMFEEHPKAEAEVEVNSLRFPSRDTAVEEGYFKVRRGKGTDRVVSRYSALLVREDGKWLLAIVREWPGEGLSLRDLEWLIGEWNSERDGVVARSTYAWDLNKSFLRMNFAVTTKSSGKTVTGTQYIGKDPSTGGLRSWTFGSDGGVAHAEISRDSNKWQMDTEATLGDGTSMTATNILIRIDDNTFTWQSVNNTIDGEDQPNAAPIKVTRAPSKK